MSMKAPNPAKALAMFMVLLGPLLYMIPSVPAEPSSRDIDDIVINEVFYDPLGNDVEGEYIELFNNGSTTVDLQGWKLTDSDGKGVDVIFPSMVMSSGTFVVIMTGQGTNITSPSQGPSMIYMDRTQGVWTNTGDDVLLMDASEDPVDFMAYGTGIYVDEPPDGVDWDGPSLEVEEGYSLIRYPDGKDTDSADDFIEGRPTMGSHNSPDMPPSIIDLGHTPEGPEAGMDVIVWAMVVDDILLEKVWLRIEEQDGTVNELPMSLDDGLYKATVEGRSGGGVLSLTILAQDNGGAISNSTTFNVSFTEDLTPSIIVDLSTPGLPVIPGDQVKITGQVRWSNGSMAGGWVNVTIPKTMGSWSTDLDGFFSIWIEAPFLEGTYDLNIVISAGTETVTRKFEMEVEWPHEALELELGLSNTTMMTGEGFIVEGEALFSDGIPASAAKVILLVEGSQETGDGTTNDNGSFKILLHAPSLAGNYTVEASVEDLGRKATATVQIDVNDNIRVTVREYPDYLLGKGRSHIVTGQDLEMEGIHRP